MNTLKLLKINHYFDEFNKIIFQILNHIRKYFCSRQIKKKNSNTNYVILHCRQSNINNDAQIFYIHQLIKLKIMALQII